MKYAICYNPDINTSKEVMMHLKSLLNERTQSADVLTIDELNQGYDFVFVIGGDGTILKTARFYSQYNTPVFGINLGRLGFLSQASNSELEYAVEQILSGNYKVENRLMLSCGEYSALNDFVVKGSDTSRISNFVLKINEKEVCEYLADGIIISTPTGSTAYGMAAGGPILAPDINNIVIVPICPHTFSARPLVVGADNEISVVAGNNSSYCVSADGQTAFSFEKCFTVKKSENYAKLALLTENDFYTILRNKLNWGVSPVKL